MIARTLAVVRTSLAADPGGLDQYGGPRAFRLLASDLCGAAAKRLAADLFRVPAGRPVQPPRAQPGLK